MTILDRALAEIKNTGDLAEKFNAVKTTSSTVNDDEILLPSDATTFTESAQLIFAKLARHGECFTRGGVVVELLQTESGPVLEVMRPESFRSRIEKMGTTKAYIRYKDKPALINKRCSMDSASALLATTEARELLPPIRLIANSPLLVVDNGQLVTLSPGYNSQAGGVLVTGKQVPVVVSIKDAVDSLHNLLCDFDFVNQGDASRAIAAMITPCLRMGRLLDGHAPVDIAEADQSQSGKGYRHEIVRAIYNEAAYPITQKTGGVGSLDESLNAALLSGRPFLTLDNLRGNLSSQFLEMVLTWRSDVRVRVPHRGEISVSCSGVTFQLSSNGVSTTRDLANRSSIVRIRKRVKGYQFKKWPEGSTLAHVQKNQPFYLGCVHAVVRAWFNAGKPSGDTSSHDFREWAGPLDWIVTNLFNSAPLMHGHEAAQERVSNPALVWLRAVALAVIQTGDKGKELSASALWEITQTENIELPGVSLELETGKGWIAIGRVMRKIFKDETEIVVDGVIIEKKTSQETNENRQVRDVIRYTFWPETSLQHVQHGAITYIERRTFP